MGCNVLKLPVYNPLFVVLTDHSIAIAEFHDFLSLVAYMQNIAPYHEWRQVRRILTREEVKYVNHLPLLG